MFAIGEILYRLTSRDEKTLLVDPFFRDSGLQTVPATLTQLTFNFSVPVDRLLYLHDVNISLEATAGATWDFLSCTVADAGGRVGTIQNRRAAAGLTGDNEFVTGAAGKSVNITLQARILVPPQVSQLQINVNRQGTANPANWSAKVSGYLLPPGGIGRNSYGIG